MPERKTKLRPGPEDYKGATGRAREFADRLAVSDRTFSDSMGMIRQGRDTRV